MPRLFVLSAIILLSGPLAGANQSTDELRAEIDRIHQNLGVPGLSVAVTLGDEVVLTYGAGVQSANRPDRVTPDTAFPLASISKSFTALALADAVASGDLSWSDQLSERIEGLEFKSDEATLHATIDDAVSHRTGADPGGLVGMHAGLSRRELAAKLADFDMIAPRGQMFIYNNLIYSALGLVFEDALGETWEAAVHRRVLDPLEMNRSGTNGVRDVVGNSVANHAPRSGAWAPVAPASNPALGPASRVTSTATDMAKLMIALLAEPSDDAHYRALFEDTSQPRALVDWGGWMTDAFPDCSAFAYGRGWFLAQRAGQRVVYHPGGGGGVAALLFLIPEERFGVTVLTNYDDYAAIFAIANTIADRLLGGAPVDWIAALEDHRTDLEGQASEVHEWLSGRPSEPLPHLPLESYEGIYTHELFGSVEIQRADERLVFVRGNLRGTMSHWDRDSFLVRLEQTAFLYDIVTFTVGTDRQAIELLVFDQGGFRRPAPENHH